MRFPVAHIVKETNFNKGYVSAVLQGKKPISDNFWQTFNEKFPDRQPDPATVILPTGDVKRTHQPSWMVIRLSPTFHASSATIIARAMAPWRNAGLIQIRKGARRPSTTASTGVSSGTPSSGPARRAGHRMAIPSNAAASAVFTANYAMS